MGSADRIIRVIITVIIATLYFTNVVTGTLGIVLLILASVFLLTSFISFCPIYAPFGLSTCAIKEKNKAANSLLNFKLLRFSLVIEFIDLIIGRRF